MRDALYNFIIDSANLEFPCKIKKSIDEPNGKWPKDLGNAMVMRIKNFEDVLVSNIVEAWAGFVEEVEQDYNLLI